VSAAEKATIDKVLVSIPIFRNKFRKLGFVDYTNRGELTVNSGLLSIVLDD
jgi:hypothetical protein